MVTPVESAGLVKSRKRNYATGELRKGREGYRCGDCRTLAEINPIGSTTAHMRLCEDWAVGGAMASIRRDRSLEAPWCSPATSWRAITLLSLRN